MEFFARKKVLPPKLIRRGCELCFFLSRQEFFPAKLFYTGTTNMIILWFAATTLDFWGSMRGAIRGAMRGAMRGLFYTGTNNMIILWFAATTLDFWGSMRGAIRGAMRGAMRGLFYTVT